MRGVRCEYLDGVGERDGDGEWQSLGHSDDEHGDADHNEVYELCQVRHAPSTRRGQQVVLDRELHEQDAHRAQRRHRSCTCTHIHIHFDIELDIDVDMYILIHK